MGRDQGNVPIALQPDVLARLQLQESVRPTRRANTATRSAAPTSSAPHYVEELQAWQTCGDARGACAQQRLRFETAGASSKTPDFDDVKRSASQ